MNYTTDYLGRPAIAVGAPGSPARRRVEEGPLFISGGPRATHRVTDDAATPSGRLLTNSERRAVYELGNLTAWRYDFWILAGSAKASCRAAVMSALNGQRTPQSKSGVTVLRERMQALAEVKGECIAARDDEFRAWARSVVVHSSNPPSGQRPRFRAGLTKPARWHWPGKCSASAPARATTRGRFSTNHATGDLGKWHLQSRSATPTPRRPRLTVSCFFAWETFTKRLR